MCIPCAENCKTEADKAKEERLAAKARRDCKSAKKYLIDDGKVNSCILRWRAQQRNAPAQSALGSNLLRGTTGEKNVREELHWLTKAADQGDELAQSNVGHLWFTGRRDLNMPINMNKAWEYALPSARCGDPNGMLLCALVSAERGNKEDAVKWMSLGATQQYPLCMAWMGRAYDVCEWGLERDVFKVLYWYRKAALAKFGVARLLTIVQEAKKAVFDGCDDPVGYSAIPESFFWAHLECDGFDSNEVHFDMMPAKCGCSGDHNCYLCECQCNAIEYCSKKCKKKHWIMGHKMDCLTEEKKNAWMTIDGATLDLQMSTLSTQVNCHVIGSRGTWHCTGGLSICTE
jgi:Sel1 repeat